MLRLRFIPQQLSGIVHRTFTVTTSNRKHESDDKTNPMKRTIQILGNDLSRMKDRIKSTFSEGGNVVPDEQFQTHCDILVVGGGGVGSSVAYWLKEKARDGLNVVVVERDPTYKSASTSLSVGGLRQQFSLLENVQMSLYAADFMREVKSHLGNDVELDFQPHGYLLLASEAGAETLKNNSYLQNKLGARNELLTPQRLKAKFPWINTDGIALGCHGLEKEGWFNPWALLMGFRNKAKEYGAHFVHGTVEDFEFQNRDEIDIGDANTDSGYNAVNRVLIRMPNGEMRSIKFAICVVAAGAASGSVGRLLKMGTGPGILKVPLPVEPRKRYVYVICSQGINAPGFGCPLTIDPDGTYFRRDGLCGNYICGRSPSSDEEPSVDNLDVDHDFFDEHIWPTLAHRVKAFESAKVHSSWAGFYEYNVFDRNGIIGPHPSYHNVYIATGFSGHGIQQTPAVGRAIAELIIDGQFRTIDLTRLGFDRILVDRPMYEVNIV